MRRSLSGLLVVVFVWVMIPAASTPTVIAQGTTPIKVGVLSDLSGELLLYGIEHVYGFTLGAEYATGGTMAIAGRPLEIIVRDYGGDSALAVTQARELIEVEGVELLVGAPSSSVTRELMLLAAEKQVILMAGPAADPRITGAWFEPTTFRVCHNAIHDAAALAAWAVENVGTRFVQLAPDHPYGYAWTNAFEEGFAAQGAIFAAAPIYAPTTTADFTPYLRQVADVGADGIIITWAGSGLSPLYQQMAEVGLSAESGKPAVLTLFSSNDVVSAFGHPSQIGVTGLVTYHHALPQNEINDWLVERYLDEYNDVPDQFSECGFASALALSEALRITEGNTLSEALIPALEGLSFAGPRGAYAIRAEDHQAVMPATIARLVSVNDPGQQFYERVAEISPEQIILPCAAPENRSSDLLSCAGE